MPRRRSSTCHRLEAMPGSRSSTSAITAYSILSFELRGNIAEFIIGFLLGIPADTALLYVHLSSIAELGSTGPYQLYSTLLHSEVGRGVWPCRPTNGYFLPKSQIAAALALNNLECCGRRPPSSQLFCWYPPFCAATYCRGHARHDGRLS